MVGNQHPQRLKNCGVSFKRLIRLLLLTAIAILLIYPRPIVLASNPAKATAPFNQPGYYPLDQTIAANYRPVGTWVGRLILPTQEQIQSAASNPADWVWLEVAHAPLAAKALIGQIMRLEWSKASVSAYVQTVTREVNFTGATEESKRNGAIVPDRLNHRSPVGPLQSLAGARPQDDVIVKLDPVVVAATSDPAGIAGQSATPTTNLPVLQIDREPVLVTGRFLGLVKILGSAASNQNVPKDCPGKLPCASEWVRVRHYNPASGQFNGPRETIRIPQQPSGGSGIFPSTPRQLESSPVGKAGWYVYGAKDPSGRFVVQAIQPRSLLQLQPNQVILGLAAGVNYINNEHWHNTEAQKGTAQTVLVDPTATQPKGALAAWKEGDQALVVHLFGGIGGKKAEQQSYGTVSGHFAYGLAQVVRPFTGELQFDLQYQQVYAHNPDGIIAGTTTWANYMGNLQRGWLGTRPVSDVLIKLDAVTQDYNFDGIKLSPLQELLHQLQIMMARYRVGDGTGSATVTPAISCVQDSSQALYIAIQQIKQQVTTTPRIQGWLEIHPDHPQTLRFQKLVALGKVLETELAPSGTVRPDWQQNAGLAGTRVQGRFVRINAPLNALLSWRTLLPRVAHDEIAKIFLEQGGQLWFVRTNQVGGWDPDIQPVAPTSLFGKFIAPLAPVPGALTLIHRLSAALANLPGIHSGWIVLGTLLVYGAIALPLGFFTGFLQVSLSLNKLGNQLASIVMALFSPALTEELVFRVGLLPHPTERISLTVWCLWALASLLLFIVYHPLNAISCYRVGYPTFLQPVFLILTGLLGLGCTIAYALTGSLWVVVIIHWVVVIVWLFGLGGRQKLHTR